MGRTTSCSSSTMDNSCGHHQIVSSSELSYPSHHSSTDLSLALSISASPQPQDNNPSTSREQQPDWPPTRSSREEGNQEYNNNNNCHKSSFQSTTLFVKVYMEGIPIGRKLDLLAHDGYDALISTLDQMFRTNILWAEADGVESKRCHVLTYEDKEGDWLMVGDVPWEMFLTSARRLRITRNDRF